MANFEFNWDIIIKAHTLPLKILEIHNPSFRICRGLVNELHSRLSMETGTLETRFKSAADVVRRRDRTYSLRVELSNRKLSSEINIVMTAACCKRFTHNVQGRVIFPISVL
ncbi:hypothetical protein EVAR_10616_1 [Eumeta japonica]|uniref:Uncharacterized protein n=1 Tax=Eumeta variegata TaxID=151549 RepID=A0A4C1U216_EUMVA|nr:hypothetical protein EVAR_10616_1 [Eumeta japonica]